MTQLNSYTTDWLTKSAKYYPSLVAIEELESGQNITYKDLNRQANYLAYYLVNVLHFKCGDRIVIIAEHSIAYAVLIGVAQKTGIILVPLNYQLTRSLI